MPTYEYVCGDCGYEFEQFQPITARALRKCPKCRKATLKRLIGIGSGVIFKGSGFYQTDYRSESYKSGEKSEKGTPDTAAAGERKTDKKSKDSKTASESKTEAKEKKKSA
ncbi:MAG TPA: zinc ribbon domain-containing protein [Sedimentisphaerales bacterium]|nr:zinc ribbon domain-containing protein [Sedimentisphaerales bacterium]